MKDNIKFIFIDIDGTLYQTKKKEIPLSAINAIKTASKNGHKLFICSGRPKTKVDNIFYDLPFDGYIYSCWAHIEVENKTIYEITFPLIKLKNIVSFMVANHIGFVLDGLYKSFASEQAAMFYEKYYKKANETTREMLIRNGMYPFGEIKKSDYEQICKITIISPASEACKQLLKEIPEDLMGYLNTNFKDNYDHGEIYPNNIDKSKGIKRVLSYYNADIEQTIAIGDSLNDLEMIKFVHFGICMGNGAKELKENSDFVTLELEDDGIEFAFKHMDLI